ncbi:MAG TPA: metallopeptidase, partial [Candidatus Gemmiger avicola]|nr:metallopeptidase [Candidatus Gemmiger avicola]
MPGTPQTQTEWEQTVARRVMERTRSTLYIALRYLNAPLGALAPTPDPDPQRGLATNGAQLFYGASW